MILAQRNLINAGWSRCLTSHHWIFLTLVLALPTTGCSNSDQDNSNPLVSTTERGPYQLSVAANQGELTFGDPLTVTLKITTPPDTEVSFPKSEAFDPLEVTSTRIETRTSDRVRRTVPYRDIRYAANQHRRSRNPRAHRRVSDQPIRPEFTCHEHARTAQ
jgi:hypothetical protein